MHIPIVANPSKIRTANSRVRPIRGEGEWRLHYPTTHPILQPQNDWGHWVRDSEGRVPDAEVFSTWQIQTASAHAHNTFCYISYSTRSIEPKLATLGHWHTTNIHHILYFRSRMRTDSLNLLLALFLIWNVIYLYALMSATQYSKFGLSYRSFFFL